MITENISLEQINRLRYSSYDDDSAVANLVSRLVDNPISNDSNDYMMAEYALIAGYMWSQGMTQEGKVYIEVALKFALYVSDRRSLVDVYILAGNYATLDGGVSEALTWYFKALDLSEAIDCREEIPRIYNNIGTLFIHCKNMEQGIAYMLEAEKFSKRMTDAFILSDIYNNLAEAFFIIQDFERAKHYIELMERHLAYQGSIIHRLNHLINKWRYALHLGDIAQGETIFLESRRLLKQLPHGNDQLVSTLSIFDILVEMGRAAIAIEWLEQDIVYLSEVEDFGNLKKYYMKLIDYYSANQDEEKKLYYIEKSYENDVKFSEVQLKTDGRALISITETRKSSEKERIENKTAYTALNDENSRLLAVNNNLRFIHDIGVRILSTTDLEEIYDILLEKVNELFQVYDFAIGALNQTGDALIFKYSSRKSEAKKKTREIPLSNTKAITVDCFINNKEIIINDCEKETPERYANMVKRNDVQQSLIFLPIVVNGVPYGVMTVQHAQKNAFSSLHLEVFRLLATFASVSFKNSQHNSNLTKEIEKRSVIQSELEVINERLDYLARHDTLTGVYNRRTLERVYGEVFEEARRFGKHLTVMLLDIDNFKQYNDSYGHVSGDRCIVKVADMLRETLKRQQDFIARYGGDEFMVLLPETDALGAEHVAEKLVDAIRGLRIENRGSQVSSYVTISLGVVCKEIQLLDTADDLLLAADKALYKVKKELGRNAYYIDRK